MVEDVLQTVLDRAVYLDTLEQGPLAQSALAEAVGVSRSTVDRAVRELSTHGLVTRSEDAVALTAAGRLVAFCLDRHREDVAAILATQPLLEHVPPDAPLDTTVLTGATVRQVAPPDPYQAADRIGDLFDAGDQVYALSVALTDDRAPQIIFDAVVEQGTTYEAVYASNVASVLQTWQSADRREMAATGRYRAYEVETLPFGLFFRDGTAGSTGSDGAGSQSATAPPPRVAVAVYDDANDLHGVIYNDTDDAAAWARETFARYRDGARDVTDEFRPAESD
jgi:DNA-binding Lrp family transcriptional regulator